MITPGTYKHSKTGGLFQVHFIAKLEDGYKDVVVYEALEENPISKYWVRDLSEFEEMIELNGNQVIRFVRQ